MKEGFFRFPSTPHLAWLNLDFVPREDKILSSDEVKDLLACDVVVEEKLDGANIGFSLSPDGGLRVQNRGQFLVRPFAGQFTRLSAWIDQHEVGLCAVLETRLIVFGEWCAARHSLDYKRLPDWFFLFDVYDLKERCFWSTNRRNQLAADAGVHIVPTISRGRTTLEELKVMVMNKPSRFRSDLPMEGVVVRKDSGDWSDVRAKLVRPDFVQNIDSHWSKRVIEWNRLDWMPE